MVGCIGLATPDGLVHQNHETLETRLQLDILPQPDPFTCGPTCLHAVYRYFDRPMALADVAEETDRLENGGTLAVQLACHALRRGFRATIFTYNLQIFDPTWFTAPRVSLAEKLRAQVALKDDVRLQTATDAYLDYLGQGGRLRFEDLTARLIRSYLNRGIPILTGLSSTYLYRAMREYGPLDDDDDIRGEPSGHFVVLCGYHRQNRSVLVADPLYPNPVASSQVYEVNIDRLICAILLGVLTYDANLLILNPNHKA